MWVERLADAKTEVDILSLLAEVEHLITDFRRRVCVSDSEVSYFVVLQQKADWEDDLQTVPDQLLGLGPQSWGVTGVSLLKQDDGYVNAVWLGEPSEFHAAKSAREAARLFLSELDEFLLLNDRFPKLAPKLEMERAEVERIWSNIEAVEEEKVIYRVAKLCTVLAVYEEEKLVSIRFDWLSVDEPSEDLTWVFDMFADGHSWNEVQPGYQYWRADRRIRISCSAMPMIGVSLIR